MGTESSASVSNGASSSFAWENTLSPRFYLFSFLALFLLVAFLLWGVYVPVMNGFAEEAIAEGDVFRARAEVLVRENPENIRIAEFLDDRILEVTPLIPLQQELSFIANDVQKEEECRRRGIPRLRALEQSLRNLPVKAEGVVKEAGLSDTFAFLLKALQKRFQDSEKSLKEAVESGNGTATFAPFSEFSAVQLPLVLGEVKRIRDLFDVESCFDRSMQKYIHAASLSRFSSKVRLRLADLYRVRNWPEFAQAEYLRVMKLDPDGGDGRVAFERLRDYKGLHGEAGYFLGVAHLMREEYSAAETAFREFVERQPQNVLAPSAWQLVTMIESGDHRILRRFVRDEVWI